MDVASVARLSAEAIQGMKKPFAASWLRSLGVTGITASSGSFDGVCWRDSETEYETVIDVLEAVVASLNSQLQSGERNRTLASLHELLVDEKEKEKEKEKEELTPELAFELAAARYSSWTQEEYAVRYRMVRSGALVYAPGNGRIIVIYEAETEQGAVVAGGPYAVRVPVRRDGLSWAVPERAKVADLTAQLKSDGFDLGTFSKVDDGAS